MQSGVPDFPKKLKVCFKECGIELQLKLYMLDCTLRTGERKRLHYTIQGTS